MKRTFLLIVGYYLYFQAGVAALGVLSMPENAVILLTLGGFGAWGGYELIKRANRKPQLPPDSQPTSQLQDVPETRPLSKH